MIHHHRNSLRLTAVAFIGASAVALSTTSAFAKSDAELTVSGHHAHVGDTVAVKAAGGNDDGQPTSLCAQERQGTTGAWHTLACTPVTVDPTPHLRLRVRAVHPGTMQFRALLSETDAKTHRPRLLSRSSTEGVSVTR